MLVDTHAHIYSEDYDSDFYEMLQRAEEADIQHIIMPGVSKEDYPRITRALETNSGLRLSAAIGLHPSYVREDYLDELGFIDQHKRSKPWIAVGEIGLDYYRGVDFKAEQLAALNYQLGLALELDLPVIFHVREAYADIVKVLGQPEWAGIRGVLHSFTGSREELEAILHFPNLMVAINGVATFKNAQLRNYIGIIPIERLLLETDAPYLAPTPLRGKRNEPAFMRHTAEHIAPLWGLSLEELATATTRNAQHLFAI